MSSRLILLRHRKGDALPEALVIDTDPDCVAKTQLDLLHEDEAVRQLEEVAQRVHHSDDPARLRPRANEHGVESIEILEDVFELSVSGRERKILETIGDGQFRDLTPRRSNHGHGSCKRSIREDAHKALTCSYRCLGEARALKHS